MGEKKQPSEKQINFAKSLGIESPEKYDMATLSGMIEAESNSGSTEGFKDTTDNKKPVVETEKVQVSERDHKYDKDPTGLAVEVYIKMLSADMDFGKSFEKIDYEAWMNKAIIVVKQAQEAFK